MPNPFKFPNDPMARKLSDLWFEQRTSAATGQKDAAGKAYLMLILHISLKTIEAFLKRDGSAEYCLADIAIGDAQSGVSFDTNVIPFWDEIAKIFPDVYTKELLDYLKQRGGLLAVFHFLFQIDPVTKETSPVMRAININAHASR